MRTKVLLVRENYREKCRQHPPDESASGGTQVIKIGDEKFSGSIIDDLDTED